MLLTLQRIELQLEEGDRDGALAQARKLVSWLEGDEPDGQGSRKYSGASTSDPADLSLRIERLEEQIQGWVCAVRIAQEKAKEATSFNAKVHQI